MNVDLGREVKKKSVTEYIAIGQLQFVKSAALMPSSPHLQLLYMLSFYTFKHVLKHAFHRKLLCTLYFG